jgi:cyclic lactone autoinducer peptide
MLKLVSRIAENAIKKANGRHSLYWTYQPKRPAGIKNFKP